MPRTFYANVLLTIKKPEEGKSSIHGMDTEIDIKGLFGWCLMQIKSPKGKVAISLIEVSKARTEAYHLNIETITQQDFLSDENAVPLEDSAESFGETVKIDLSPEQGVSRTIIQTLDELYAFLLSKAKEELGEGEIQIINVKISRKEDDDFSSKHF